MRLLGIFVTTKDILKSLMSVLCNDKKNPIFLWIYKPETVKQWEGSNPAAVILNTHKASTWPYLCLYFGEDIKSWSSKEGHRNDTGPGKQVFSIEA